MTRLRKDQAESLLAALDSATSGPLEEITVVRAALTTALRAVLDSEAGWRDLITEATRVDGWSSERHDLLTRAERPEHDVDPDGVLWALWDLVTELNERRSLGN